MKFIDHALLTVIDLALAALFAWLLRNTKVLAVVAVVAVVVAGIAFAVVRSEGADDEPDAIEVLVVWGESELADFRRVAEEYDRPVVVRSTGENIGAALDQRFADDDPPDVAIIPQPSLVRRYADEGLLQRMDQSVVDRFPAEWNELVAGLGPDNFYGAWVKGTSKSLFWFQPDAFGGEVPNDWSWADLTNWVHANVDNEQFEAPLTLPAKNRWPLTDWFENQLAALDADLYDELATGSQTDWDQPEVRTALSNMADLWGVPDIFPGGPQGAADTEWQDLTTRLTDGTAAVMFGPSFLAGPVSDLDMPVGARPQPRGFPRLAGELSRVVGGDVAVVPTESTKGQRFVDWLTDQEALNLWSQADRGFLTPNENTPYLPEVAPAEDDIHILLTHYLRNPPDHRLHFDLSDQFGVVNEGDPRATWDIFDDFFAEVTKDVPDVPCAIDQVIERLDAESRGEDQPELAC